ncbi:lysoplasmalogenase TMEM86A isoform X2 [Equus przewalskii]|uniref:lysoplasmalogenase n=2 Tax=Equus TaxID=9789 RepID=A0A5F5PTB4_HORSE|nr:lysoplasmalogenase-like protein TMEM86A isoform X2 [Equus caballus]
MCIAVCPGQECVCLSAKRGPHPGTGITVTFLDASPGFPEGRGPGGTHPPVREEKPLLSPQKPGGLGGVEARPRPPSSPACSVAVSAVTSRGSQSKDPAPGAREVLSVAPGFVNVVASSHGPSASWPLQLGAGARRRRRRRHGVPCHCGVLMFAVTHMLYASAFGMRPLALRTGLVMAVLAGLYYALLYPGLSGAFTYLVGVYVAIITFMGWRAVAGLQLVGAAWRWTELAAGSGAVLFMVSDMTIGINKFCFPVPYSRALIMSTYYAAQMLIALSAVESREPVEDYRLSKAN